MRAEGPSNLTATVWKALPGLSTALNAAKNSLRQEINKALTNASALVLIGENLNSGRERSFLIYSTISAPSGLSLKIALENHQRKGISTPSDISHLVSLLHHSAKVQ